MALRVGASGLLFVLIMSGCSGTPTPDASVDAGLVEDAGRQDLVIIETRDFYGGPYGDGGTFPARPNPYSVMKLYAGGATGPVIEGTYVDGQVIFEGVPTADNVIELHTTSPVAGDVPWVQIFEANRRDIVFALREWARPDRQKTDASVEVTLDLDGIEPWEFGYTLIQFHSSIGELSRTTYDVPEALLDGGTHLTGWTADLSEMISDEFTPNTPLLDFTKGDDLSIVQKKDRYPEASTTGPLDVWNPWYNGYGVFSVARAQVSSPRFIEGTPTAISATFSALPVTNAVLDFRGSTFAATRAENAPAANARASASAYVIYEPGDGEWLNLGLAPIVWDQTSRPSQRVPNEPGCYPDSQGTCDAGCLNGCNATLSMTYADPGDVQLPISITHPFTTPGTEMLSYDYTLRQTFNFDDGGTATLSASSNGFVQFTPSATVTIERTLSAPRELKLDGVTAPLTATTITPVAPNATVTWLAPTTGTVDYYRVFLVDITPGPDANGSRRFSRTTATLTTEGTSMKLPSAAMVEGHLYFVRVTANTDPDERLDSRKQRRASHVKRTDVISGVIALQ